MGDADSITLTVPGALVPDHIRIIRDHADGTQSVTDYPVGAGQLVLEASQLKVDLAVAKAALKWIARVDGSTGQGKIRDLARAALDQIKAAW